VQKPQTVRCRVSIKLCVQLLPAFCCVRPTFAALLAVVVQTSQGILGCLLSPGMPEVSVRYIHNDCFGAQFSLNTMTLTSTNTWAIGHAQCKMCHFAQA